MSRYIIVPTEYTDGIAYFIKDTIQDRFIAITLYPERIWKTYNKSLAENLVEKFNDKWENEGKYQPA